MSNWAFSLNKVFIIIIITPHYYNYHKACLDETFVPAQTWIRSELIVYMDFYSELKVNSEQILLLHP